MLSERVTVRGDKKTAPRLDRVSSLCPLCLCVSNAFKKSRKHRGTEITEGSTSDFIAAVRSAFLE